MMRIRYKGRVYRRVATDLFGMKWFTASEIKKLTDLLQDWGSRESPKVGRVFWHDGEQKWLLIPGNPSEKEVAEYLSYGNPKKFEKQQRELRPANYLEIEDRCRRCMGIDWAKVKNFFKAREYRQWDD